mmetsp:Transcript_14325/g.22216  ORF Transcript_14325/g.22216 Transcript_14325/m.22216 type:complete len:87 (+) Transcript_14325:127-387(+)
MKRYFDTQGRVDTFGNCSRGDWSMFLIVLASSTQLWLGPWQIQTVSLSASWNTAGWDRCQTSVYCVKLRRQGCIEYRSDTGRVSAC